MNTRFAALAAAIAVALFLAPAYAADAPQGEKADAAAPQTGSQGSAANDDDAQTLAAIRVSATKRDQLMTDVPVTIDVVTAEDIETAGITTARDLNMVVPGFNFVALPAEAASNVVMRGLSETIGEPNVSFFVDGVYIPSRDALDFMLDGNIARVEVAKGPQYALYGQNSFAGAVNFETASPSDVTEGSVLLRLGNHDRRKVRAILSGPFAESSGFHYRVGVNSDEFGGFYRNELTGRQLDRQRKSGAFLTLTAAPGGIFDGRFTLIHNRVRNRDHAEQYVENDWHFFAPFNDYQMYDGALPSLRNGFAVTPGHRESDNTLAALSLNWDLDWARLTSVTSWNRLRLDTLFDSDYSAAPIQMTYIHGPERSVAEDLRLVSQTDGAIEWLAGLYYYNQTGHPISETQWQGAAAPVFGGLVSDNRARTRSLAFYGSATWHMSEQWDLGVMLRKTRETKSIHTVTTTQPAMTTPGGVTPFDASSRFTPFTPGVNIAWKPTDGAMVYASAVKAIKVGGFNTFTSNGAIAPDERAYKPERSKTYELGAKFSPLDGRMLVDLGLYRIDWQDQIVRTIGSMGALLNTNAGETRSKGFEATMQYDPNRNWSFRLGGSYNDSKYVEYVFPIVGLVGLNPDLSGVRLQYSPRLIGNASVLNRNYLANGWTWTTRLDARHQGRMNAVQTGHAWTPARNVVNLRSALDFGRFEVALWADNLFNNTVATSSLFATNPGTTFAFATGQRPGNQLFQALVSAPELRTFGVDVLFHF